MCGSLSRTAATPAELVAMVHKLIPCLLSFILTLFVNVCVYVVGVAVHSCAIHRVVQRCRTPLGVDLSIRCLQDLLFGLSS